MRQNVFRLLVTLDSLRMKADFLKNKECTFSIVTYEGLPALKIEPPVFLPSNLLLNQYQEGVSRFFSITYVALNGRHALASG